MTCRRDDDDDDNNSNESTNGGVDWKFSHLAQVNDIILEAVPVSGEKKEEVLTQPKE